MKICQLASCGKELTKREDEPIWNFNSRIYCNKRCAAIVANSKRKGIKKLRKSKQVDVTQAIIVNTKLACITYAPGSPEFLELAKLYK